MQYQLLFIIAIVTVQVILQVVWLQLTPGHAEMNYDHPEVTLLQCRYVSYVGPVVAIGKLYTSLTRPLSIITYLI